MSITRARLECRAASKGNAAVQAGAKKERERWYEQILQALLRHKIVGDSATISVNYQLLT